jgi:hypothetical protein
MFEQFIQTPGTSQLLPTFRSSRESRETTLWGIYCLSDDGKINVESGVKSIMSPAGKDMKVCLDIDES